MITPPQTLLLILGHQQTLVSCTSQIPLLRLVQESPTGLKTRLPHFLAIPVLQSISQHHILPLYQHSYDPLHRIGSSLYKSITGVFICHRVKLLIGLQGTRDRRALSEFSLHSDRITNVTGTLWRMFPCPYDNRLLCGTRSDSTEQQCHSDPWISNPLPASL